MTTAPVTLPHPARGALMMLALAIGLLALAGCAEPVAECEAGVADIARTAEVMPPC